VKKEIWLALLSEFEMEIKHIKGKQDRIVDVLSRYSHSLIVSVESSVKTYFEEHIQLAVQQD